MEFVMTEERVECPQCSVATFYIDRKTSRMRITCTSCSTSCYVKNKENEQENEQ